MWTISVQDMTLEPGGRTCRAQRLRESQLNSDVWRESQRCGFPFEDEGSEVARSVTPGVVDDKYRDHRLTPAHEF